MSDSVTSNPSSRIRYIDVAKGIGILLVVLGHLMIPGQLLKDCIYAFHMPLFLILSGYFEKDGADIVERFKKLSKRLYLPFACFLIIDVIWAIAKYSFAGGEGFDISRMQKWSVPIFKVFSKALVGHSYLYNLPLWFLFSLFIIKIVYTIISQIGNKKIRYAIIISIMSIAFAYMFIFKDLGIYNRHLPVYAILPSFLFYSIGYFSKNAIKKPNTILQDNDRKHFRLLMGAAVIAGILLPLLVKYNGYTEIYGCQFRRPPLLVFNGLLGTFAIITVSAFISNNQALKRICDFFSFWGRNSIKVLVTHYILTDHLFIWIYIKLDILDLMITPLHEFCLFILTVAIEYIIVLCANRFLLFIKNKE